MSAYDEIKQFFITNKGTTKAHLWTEFLSEKYRCLQVDGYIREKAATRLIKELGLVYVPGYKMYPELPIGSDAYVFEDDLHLF